MDDMWAIAAAIVGVAWAVSTRKMVVAWLERRHGPADLATAVRLAELQVSVAVVQEQLAAVTEELRALRGDVARVEPGGAGVPRALPAAAIGDARPVVDGASLPVRQDR